jgi:hypothetical protein
LHQKDNHLRTAASEPGLALHTLFLQRDNQLLIDIQGAFSFVSLLLLFGGLPG